MYNCSDCDKQKIILAHLDEHEISSYELCQNKIRCAKQTIGLECIPEGTSLEGIKAFTIGVLEVLSNAEWLLGEWRKAIINKYGIQEYSNFEIDNIDNTIFICKQKE